MKVIKEREADRYLHVETASYEAGYDHQAEDYHSEFVQEATVELRRDVHADLADESEPKIVTCARFDVLVIRCSRSSEGIDVLDMADAHSGEAEEVVGHLHFADHTEFYDQFETIPQYANVLLIDDWDLGTGKDKLSTEEIRRFVRRTADQFNVDLVFIRIRDEALSQHFKQFFEQSGPFLVYSKSYLWPESESAPEPVITSAGGQA